MAGKVIDISGKQFGSWQVLSFDRVSPYGAYFNAQCVCGTKRSVLAKSLKTGVSVSCGCSFRGKPGVSSCRSIFNSYRRGALKRDLLFEITFEQFAALTSKRCHYCDVIPLQTNKNLSRYMAPYIYNGVDRLDSSIGYTLSNCVPCCGVCNHMKGNMVYAAFISRCRKIIETHEARREPS